jgi:hypothetical protein
MTLTTCCGDGPHVPPVLELEELLLELDELLEWPEELLLELLELELLELLLLELELELLLCPDELLLLLELDELLLLEEPDPPPVTARDVSVGRPAPLPQNPKLAVPPLAAMAAS